MSLESQVENGIPDETVKVAKACCGKKNQLVTLRDRFGPLFRNSDFTDIYSWKGSLGIAPELLASVTVLQHVVKTKQQRSKENKNGIDKKPTNGKRK